MADLLEWNRELEQTCDLREYDAIEDMFLWGSDPFEKYFQKIPVKGEEYKCLTKKK